MGFDRLLRSRGKQRQGFHGCAEDNQIVQMQVCRRITSFDELVVHLTPF